MFISIRRLLETGRAGYHLASMRTDEEQNIHIEHRIAEIEARLEDVPSSTRVDPERKQLERQLAALRTKQRANSLRSARSSRKLQTAARRIADDSERARQLALPRNSKSASPLEQASELIVSALGELIPDLTERDLYTAMMRFSWCWEQHERHFARGGKSLEVPVLPWVLLTPASLPDDREAIVLALVDAHAAAAANLLFSSDADPASDIGLIEFEPQGALGEPQGPPGMTVKQSIHTCLICRLSFSTERTFCRCGRKLEPAIAHTCL